MATKLVKQITSWSFSRYSDYKLCPLKAKLKHVDKRKEPSSSAMERGTMIHTLAEEFIKSKITKLPPELKLFEPEFKALRAQYRKKDNGMVVEDNWSFTNDWSETAWDDWVGCWVRIKLDCAHHEGDDVLIVTDWKTGKFRESSNADYMEQLELYALAALVLHPHLKEVRPRLAYLDEGVFYPENPNELVFVPADIDRLKATWEKRTKAMLSDTVFAPRPNNLCRWCHFRKDNNGPCEF